MDRPGLGFGLALEVLKRGGKVARHGWHGRSMFIYIVREVIDESEGWEHAYRPFPKHSRVHCLPYIMIMLKTASDDITVVPWAASQSDILGTDWYIVEGS